MIAHDTIVQSAVQPFGTSFTENESNMYLFSRITIMNGQVGAGNSYTIDTVLTIAVNEQG